MTSINLFNTITEVDVPVYFVVGRCDKIVFLGDVKKYFYLLKALKKKLFIFEESGYLSCFEEPDKFNEIIVKQVRSACD